MHENDRSLCNARRINGSAGEGLFQYLAAFHWRAEVVQHGNAQGTDAHLVWPDLPYGQQLSVQVKTTTKRVSARAKLVTLWLAPSKISGWAARRPILVLCDLNSACAWWLDTAVANIPFEPRKRTRFEIPLANRVDATSRDQIRRIAVDRWYRSIDYPSPPQRMRNVRPDAAKGAIEDAYDQIGATEGIDRDVIALATTRFLLKSYRIKRAKR